MAHVSAARLACAALALALAPIAPSLATASTARTAPKTHLARIREACAPPAPGHAACSALVRDPVAAGAAASGAAVPYRLDAGASAPGPAGGLTPGQLAGVYGYEPGVGGGGQTLAIVDAFDDPEIESDLGVFDGEYGLSPCDAADGCFEKISQTGSGASLPGPDHNGWSLEIALDVELAHAACRDCRILLVEAQNASFRNLSIATDEAVALGATEISSSYGGPESGLGAGNVDAYNHPGVVITAAAGDHGYDGWDLIDELSRGEGGIQTGQSDEMPNAPASLPSVVAVGGTTLVLTPGGARASETVWNEDGPGDSVGLARGFAQDASGGGCSTLFDAPPWQLGVPGFAGSGCGGARLAADISADGDPLSGFDVYDSDRCGAYCTEHELGRGWLTAGGTSLGTPLIAALYALAGGSGGVAYPALTPYAHLGDASALFDVSSGGNGFCGSEDAAACGKPNALFGRVDCEGTTACNAAPGFDGPSGVGAPNGLSAFRVRLPAAVITSPSAIEAGAAAGFSATASSDPYPGAVIERYTWSWGDGSTDTSGASAGHTFAAPGSYTVTLTVTDSYGVSGASTATLTVTAPRPPEAPAITGIAGFHTRVALHAPHARVANSSLLAAASGTVSIAITCPAGADRCLGSVALSAAGGAAGAVLAHRSFSLAAASARRLRLRLSTRALSVLERKRRMRVRVRIHTHLGAGVSYATQTVLTLRPDNARAG